jgi:Flp pilus assembly pilin Flp
MRRGQSTVEYVLVISVLAIAMAAAMAVVWDAVEGGADRYGDVLVTNATTGSVQP